MGWLFLLLILPTISNAYGLTLDHGNSTFIHQYLPNTVHFSGSTKDSRTEITANLIHLDGTMKSSKIAVRDGSFASAFPLDDWFEAGTYKIQMSDSKNHNIEFDIVDYNQIELQQMQNCSECILGSIVKIIDGDTMQIGGTRVQLALVESTDEGTEEFVSSQCPVGSIAYYEIDQGSHLSGVTAEVFCGDDSINEILLREKLGKINVDLCATSKFASSSSWASICLDIPKAVDTKNDAIADDYAGIENLDEYSFDIGVDDLFTLSIYSVIIYLIAVVVIVGILYGIIKRVSRSNKKNVREQNQRRNGTSSGYAPRTKPTYEESKNLGTRSMKTKPSETNTSKNPQNLNTSSKKDISDENYDKLKKAHKRASTKFNIAKETFEANCNEWDRHYPERMLHYCDIMNHLHITLEIIVKYNVNNNDDSEMTFKNYCEKFSEDTNIEINFQTMINARNNITHSNIRSINSKYDKITIGEWIHQMKTVLSNVKEY